jgi:precorrin-6B C5,15-methyltransferase / cobalt-precorrin-6B C5,C15-methyltransferase
LDTEAALLARHASLGGTLTRIAVSRAERIGGKAGWRASMPVTQWVWVKP